MRVLVTGAAGFLGGYIVRHLVSQGHTAIAAVRNQSASLPDGVSVQRLDLLNPETIDAAISEVRPDAIVHAAAIGDPRVCEADPSLARRVNADGTAAVADACRRADLRLIFLSSEQVFDGTAAPYDEGADPKPLHEYGRTKVSGERATASLDRRGTTVRLPLVIGPSPAPDRSASDQVLRLLRRGERPQLFADEFRTPAHAADAASAVEELLGLIDPPPILHLACPDRVSRYDLGVAIARAHGLDEGLIDARRQADVKHAVPRPPDLSLRTDLAKRLLRRPPRPLVECVRET